MAPQARRAMVSGRVWLVVVSAIAVPASLSAFETYMFWRLGDHPGPLWRAAMLEVPPWLVYAALAPGIWWLAARAPLERTRALRAAAIHLPAAAIAGALYALTAAAMEFAFSADPIHAGYLELARSWWLSALPVAALTYAGILGVGYAFALWARLRERELHAAVLSAQLAEARLATLRMQLHPHFLFNSLNAIGVLVRDQNTTGATGMLTLLAELLRQVLRADGRDEVSLADELSFAKRYLAIEAIRFSDRLAVSYAIDDRLLDVAVPCFVIQPLVENALRHGVAPRARGGAIELGARAGAGGGSVEIWVRDDGVGLAGAPPGGDGRGAGIGLANTRARLAQLYGDDGTLDVAEAPGGGVIATVVVPRRAAGPAVAEVR